MTTLRAEDEGGTLVAAPAAGLRGLGRHSLLALAAAQADDLARLPGRRSGLMAHTSAAERFPPPFAPRIAFESSEVGSVRALVAAGLGVAVVPRSAAEVAGPVVGIAALDAPLLTRTASLVWREDRYLPAAAHAFLEEARAFFG